MTIAQFEVKLQSKKMITPKVLHLGFVRVDKKPLQFIPGQFITFIFTINNKIIRRSYSIATMEGHSEEIEIAVSPVEDGIGTKILFNLQLGEVLTTSGPFGRLTLPLDNYPSHIVLTATGTGITPYRSMLPQMTGILKSFPNMKFTLLLGVRYREDLLYIEDLLNFSKQHNQFHFRGYLSRESETKETYEYKGYVKDAFKDLKLHPEQDLIYLCGNPNMIDESFSLLSQAGFPSIHVRREKYISAPTPLRNK